MEDAIVEVLWADDGTWQANWRSSLTGQQQGEGGWEKSDLFMADDNGKKNAWALDGDSDQVRAAAHCIMLSRAAVLDTVEFWSAVWQVTRVAPKQPGQPWGDPSLFYFWHNHFKTMERNFTSLQKNRQGYLLTHDLELPDPAVEWDDVLRFAHYEAGPAVLMRQEELLVEMAVGIENHQSDSEGFQKRARRLINSSLVQVEFLIRANRVAQVALEQKWQKLRVSHDYTEKFTNVPYQEDEVIW